jgi:hypothetical protein
MKHDEPINHQVYLTTYVEDFDNISIAKLNKKILLGANPCNTENKIDVMSCVLIESILLKINEPKDHVMVPQGFSRVGDTLPSCSTQPQVHPITKYQGGDPIQFRISEFDFKSNSEYKTTSTSN